MERDRPTANRPDDRGATIVEYSLLLALVAVLAVGAVAWLGSTSSSSLSETGAALGGDGGGRSGAPGAPGAPGGPTPPPGDGGPPATPPPPSTPPTTAPPTPPPTTTAPPTPPPTSPPTTAPAPPAEASDWTSAEASMHNKNMWRSDVTVTVRGTDGQPLTGVNAGVQIRVTQEYLTWDGKPGERSWTTQGNLVDGAAGFTDGPLRHSDGERVVAMRYEVTNVVYHWPADPPVRWDGARPSVRVEAP